MLLIYEMYNNHKFKCIIICSESLKIPKNVPLSLESPENNLLSKFKGGFTN